MSALPEPGTGYYVEPPHGPGPAVLFLCSAWGLTAETKAKAEELADAGYSVLAPDLNDGRVAASPEEAQQMLLDADVNVVASLVQSSLRLIQAHSARPGRPAGLVGFGSGASWALWLSARLVNECCAVVAFYGSQSITFDESMSSYLLHLAADDAHVSDDEVAHLGLNLQLARRPFRVERHDGVRDGFAEAHHPNFNAAAEAISWRQTLEFLAEHLR